MSEKYNRDGENIAEDKNVKRKKRGKKKSKKKRFPKIFRVFLIAILVVFLAVGAVAMGVILNYLKDAPDIDPKNISASLDQTSSILSPDGELIEKIQAPENRTVVSLDKVPKHLQQAFIAIEDERFESHIGIDPRGIIASAVDNVRAGKIVRGASTITQQLVKNVYLTREKSWERKIKEAYLALKVEKVLSKDQILELYLNRIFLGQNAYGVQEAAQAYFSKDVEDLSVAESALIAGIAKSSVKYSPYKTIRTEDFDPERHDDIIRMDLMGEKFVAVFNPTSVERQKVVLKQMLDLGYITSSEYQEALGEDIRANLKPSNRALSGISSYFTDYLKEQVVEVLVSELGYSEDSARNELITGGLKIYSTIDLGLQKELEDVYDNFTQTLIGNSSGVRGPVLVNWKRDGAKNIIDNNGRIVYYSKSNLLTEEDDLILLKDEYRFENNQLIVKSPKMRPYKTHIDIADYYGIDDRKNLVTYTVGSISLGQDEFLVNDNKEVVFTEKYLASNKDFYEVSGNKLLVSNKFFPVSKTGIVQPQSATVILDYRSGHIKALVGGRDVEGSRILNRATASQRQPGSVMKPIATYLPALDNGFTAATPIDDIPFYSGGKLWPRNWYKAGYKGLMPLREAVQQSANVPAVKVVDKVGVKTCMKYLEKMDIISKDHPEKDSFITAKENPRNNDENLSSLGLGGMTHGLTPLEVTAAFGTIANDGVYIKPMTFSKIEDKNGDILIDNTRFETKVISKEKAYILKDILNSTVTNGIARRAQVANMATAGKTGTTQNQADIWFAGFTPYYATGVWIGNDSPAITMARGSGTTAQLWKHIMTKAHKNLESKPKFEEPEGILRVSVCKDSGLLPGPLCSSDPRGGRVYTEIFAKGTEPTSTCKVHVSAQIDSASGKLAGDSCPAGNIVSRVFIKRSPAYNPSQHNGITPTDYSYSLPGSYCNLHDGSSPTDAEDFELDIEDEEDGQDGLKDKIKDKIKDKDKDKPKPKDPEKNKDKNKKDEGVDFEFD